MIRFLLPLLLLLSSVYGQLPDNPKPRVIDKPFVFTVAIDLSSSLADGYVSQKYIQPSDNCHEINPILGHYPPAWKTYAVTLGTTAVVTGVSYVLKRKHKSYWKYTLLAETAIHIGGIEMTLENCNH